MIVFFEKKISFQLKVKKELNGPLCSKQKVAALLLFFWLLFWASLSYSEESASHQNSSKIPFTLYVINASRSMTQLDLKLFIDGKLEHIDQLSNKGIPLLSIPPHKIYTFNLPAGNHVIMLTSNSGNFSHKYPINLEKPLWGLFGYEYWSGNKHEMPPHYVEFYLQEQPLHLQ